MIKNGDLSLHVETLIDAYRTKRDTMAEALKEEFSSLAQYEIPKGDMFFWIKFDDKIDSMKLFNEAIKQGVAYVPGSVFYKDQQQSSYARLNFTNATPQDIKTSMKRLKKAYKSYE